MIDEFAMGRKNLQIQRIFDYRTLDNPTVLTFDTFFGNHSNINPLKIIRLFEIRQFFVANATVGLSNILCSMFLVEISTHKLAMKIRFDH